jgi:hypothetical protein
MSNIYKAKTKAAEAAFFVGEGELDLTPTEEADAIAAGLLEIVPREYRVLSNNYEVAEGETFKAAMLIENEAALIAGGHIERVKAAPKQKAKEAKG